MTLREMSDSKLSWLYDKIKIEYENESKPLYKRRLGGKLIAILQEQGRRNKNDKLPKK